MGGSSSGDGGSGEETGGATGSDGGAATGGKGSGGKGSGGKGSGGQAASGGSGLGGEAAGGGPTGGQAAGGQASGGEAGGGAASGGAGPLVCAPNSARDCYSGPDGTLDVGVCHGGTELCLPDGSAYGPCEGEQLPEAELCGNALDDDCDSRIDFGDDLDGDGWALCLGDCCDSSDDGCPEPAAVNVGAFEVQGNALDDDCDGETDDAPLPCDVALATDATASDDYARAMDLCSATTVSPATPEERVWGMTSSRFSLASGTGTPAAVSRSIRPFFGADNTAQAGSSLVVLSTGNAAAPGQTAPPFASFELGESLGTISATPTDWMAAHGYEQPAVPGCPPVKNPAVAYDSILYEMSVRVPTNAHSFRLQASYFASDYPEYVCNGYADRFLVLLDSVAEGNPADKNLAVFANPNGADPMIDADQAYLNSGYFPACSNGPVGCLSSVGATEVTTCTSLAPLAGTGFDTATTQCSESTTVGAGTDWLQLEGNVVPGELIKLRFILWDSGDGAQDSVVLLDNFRWSTEPARADLGQ
jgi:hypothetical protein